MRALALTLTYFPQETYADRDTVEVKFVNLTRLKSRASLSLYSDRDSLSTDTAKTQYYAMARNSALRLINVDKVHWALFATAGTFASSSDLSVAGKDLSSSLAK